MVATSGSKYVYIVDGFRTPTGRPYKKLSNFTAVQLGGLVMREHLDHHKNARDKVEEVVWGNVVSAGTGQNCGRQATLLAGLPASVPAYTVDYVCAAGMQSVILAAQSIMCGERDLVIAGGSESASNCPDLKLKNKEKTVNAGKIDSKQTVDSLIYDGLWCQLTNRHMGELCEHIVKEFSIAREEQDRFAFESHRKACQAYAQGKFLNEVIPVQISKNVVLQNDERVRKDIDMEALRSLPPAFKIGGSITAGNSSVPCDGAAAMLLASSKAVEQFGLKPLARILGHASVAVEPEMVFTATSASIKQCLNRVGLGVKDVDLFEISEAFAAQVILMQKDLKISDQKLNIWGGDIAIGHALGAVGARVLITLIHALRDQNKKIGVASICLGGGGALAMAVEAVQE